MEQFGLSSKLLYQILKAKGVKHLFHANTVLTSLTFIQKRSLLSRAYVEKNGLIQTPQKSDAEDKAYNVWDDVFLDGKDLHRQYLRANNYGPVLFVLTVEMLLSPSISNILITKNNPWYWRETDRWEDRYYSNLKEVEKDYLTGKRLDSRIMFTFRSPDTGIKLNKFLRYVGIDRPTIFIKFKSGIEKNVGDFAFEKIQNALKENGLGHIEILQRHKNEKFKLCQCNINYTVLYNFNYKEFTKRFASKP